MSFRVDKGRMGEARIDHNGNMVVTGALTRTGVFTYRHSDGTKTRELRHPDDVFDDAAVASFVQVPVTDEHPEDGRITPGNVTRYMVGNVGDTIKRDGRLMKADVVIRKEDTIAKVRGDGNKPKRELSCGYSAKVVKEDGTYNGKKYDHRQTEIRGNHVAIVKAGRAGPEARLLLDAADGLMDDDSAWLEDEALLDDHDKDVDPQGGGGGKQDNQDAGGTRVKYIKDGVVIGTGDDALKLDKLELDIPDEAVEAVEAVLAQRDTIVDALVATRTKNAELQGKLDALVEQKKDWEDPAKQEALAIVRQEVVATAMHTGFKSDDLKGKPNSEIKRMVVAQRWPNLQLDGLEDGYVEGRFGTVQDEAEAEGESFDKLQNLGDVTGQRKDGKPDVDRGDDDDLTYRQIAEQRLDGLHAKSDEQIKESGLN